MLIQTLDNFVVGEDLQLDLESFYFQKVQEVTKIWKVFISKLKKQIVWQSQIERKFLFPITTVGFWAVAQPARSISPRRSG